MSIEEMKGSLGEEGEKKMRVTVLSGFLGAGKTTLLKRILRENNKRKVDERLSIAVIVNDMGEINLDANEIKNSKLIHEEAEMVEMHNGCICCTLRGDLLRTVKSLSEENTFDYLVIESTGISEPLPVAQTFVMDVDEHEDEHEEKRDEEAEEAETKSLKKQRKLAVAETEKSSLSHYATLDTMVSVVDALNIFDVLSSIEKLSENNSTGMVGNTGLKSDGTSAPPGGATKTEDENGGAEGEEEEDDRTLAQLMLDQIEFANVIVISKVQLLLEKEREEKLGTIKALLRKLNPTARIVAPREDKYGDLDVGKELLNTGRFNMDEAVGSAGWLTELSKPEHNPETEEYGIGSIVFRAHKMPFHPRRLYDILNGFGDYSSALDASGSKDASKAGKVDQVFKGVVRSKGQMWIANCHAFPMDIHTAGKQLGILPVGRPYLAAESDEMWDEEDQNEIENIRANGRWDETFGDRCSEIVFIGVNLNKKLIVEKLNAALLTEEESEALGGVDGWKQLEDPFFGGAAPKNWFEVEYEDDEDDEEHADEPSA
eukprot:g3253.t1